MKIATVIGARPQFIKASPVSEAILKYSDFEEVIIHTGQHFDDNMSQVFFDEMGMPTPKYNLNIHSLSHGAMTGRMMEHIEDILRKEQIKVLIVYGDTNSTLAGGLAAKKIHIPVIHVEAGLRSFNMAMPEEVNRILTDRISDILCCPTKTAINNLLAEGYQNFNVKLINTGDVMYDAALKFSSKAKMPMVSIPDDFILATIHRAENTDDQNKLCQIVDAINHIHKDVPVVLPLHPRTRKRLQEYNLQLDCILIDPVGYLQMLALLKSCKLVLTDSGGVQKEAYFFNKLCLTLRDQTEWVELIEAGVNNLVKIDQELIVENVQRKLTESFPKENVNIYGDGHASEKIVQSIQKRFN